MYGKFRDQCLFLCLFVEAINNTQCCSCELSLSCEAKWLYEVREAKVEEVRNERSNNAEVEQVEVEENKSETENSEEDDESDSEFHESDYFMEDGDDSNLPY